eukprot:TRINITY_DN61784_c0_g1_i1.p1 TRINITY_DN61784_c0_g1~~TRINITY_DN61784_c0_g1_i1.p1  ORF type:complete len:158 (-),score=8.06 TRINITY_DN61784_c0_g1_i1:186-659(-)
MVNDDNQSSQSSFHISVLLIEGLVLLFVFAIFICGGIYYFYKKRHQYPYPPTSYTLDPTFNRRNIKITKLPGSMRIVIDPLGHLLLADMDANSSPRLGGVSAYSATPQMYQMDLGSTDAGSISYSAVGNQSYYTNTPILCRSEYSNDGVSETQNIVL